MDRIFAYIIVFFSFFSVVTEAEAQLYAVSSGDWSDGTVWSLTSGGVSCSCIPDSNTEVYVENGYTIRLNVSGDARSLFLSNGGNLDFSVNGTILSIFDTLEVADGSNIAGSSTAEIRFASTGNNYFIVNDAAIGVAIEEIDSYVADTLFITGSGKIDLANDLEFLTPQFVRINLSDTLHVGDNFRPRVSDVIIENHGNIEVVDQFRVEASITGSVFTNFGTSIFINGFDLNESPLAIHNYQMVISGIFQTVPVNNAFHNYANATWNYTGAIFDPDLKLYASYNNNNFIYSALGNQDIIQPQDSYYTIEFAGSGTKFTTATPLNIDRDLTISEDAILDVGTFGTDINMVDDFRSTSSQVDPLRPGSSTITINGGGLTNSIESVHGIRFYNLAVNTSERIRILSKDVLIENNFNIVNGTTYTETDGRLVIADNATITGYDNTKFIDGVVTKIGDDPFLFPLGEGVYPGFLEISAPSLTTTEYTVEYFHQAPANATLNSPLINISGVEYWNISQAVNDDDVQVTLFWQNAATSGIDDFADLTIANFNGSSWDNAGQFSISASDPGNIQSPVINNYQAVTFASTTLTSNRLLTPAPRYSIATGDWDDPNTWSYTSGGPACNCIPDETSEVHIEAGHTVYIQGHAYTRDLTVYNGGQLRWGANNFHLYIRNAGNVLIENGGRIRSSGTSKLIFDQGPSGTLTVNDATNGLYIHTILYNAAGTYSIEGSGKIYCYDDLDLNGDINLTNNLTGLFEVRDNFDFESGNNIFVNNGKLSILNDDLYIKSNNNSITNNDTLHIAGDNFYLRNITGTVLNNNGALIINNNFNLGEGDITVNNYGSISHNSFSSVDAGSEFHNRTNGVWIYRGTTSDPDIKLFTSYADNTFIYASTSNQSIIQPQDAYYVVEFNGGGVKSTNFAVLNVDRDIFIRDDAVLDVGTFGTDINVKDDFLSYSSQVDPFIPGTTTVKIGLGAGMTTGIESIHGIRFYNLETNTTERFRLRSKDLIIENNLNMVNGILHVDNDGRFIILDNATVTGYDATKFIIGPVQKIGDDAFTFPVGENSNFRPLTITAPGSATDAFTCQYFNADPHPAYDEAMKDPVINNVSDCEYWSLVQDNGASSVSVSLSWGSACPISSLSSLAVIRWNGSLWTNEGNGGTTGDVNSGTIISGAPITAFGIFSLSSITYPPNAVDDSYTIDEDIVLNDNLLTNDSDPLGYSLVMNTTPVTLPVHGILVLQANGNFSYTPDPNFHGVDNFQYEVCNSSPNVRCSTAVVTLTVNSVPDLPVSDHVEVNMLEDEVYTFQQSYSISNVTTVIPGNYERGWAEVGEKYYIDRNFTILNIPYYLEGSEIIKTANNDKLLTDADWLSFELAVNSKVYVAYDPRFTINASWLSAANGWIKTNDFLRTTDTQMPGAGFEIYEKEYAPGTVSLGANRAGSSSQTNISSYVVLVKNIDPLPAGNFSYSDDDENAFKGIEIISEETNGHLKFDTLDVTAGMLVSDINKLTFAPFPNDNGIAYATFEFKVEDGSGAQSNEIYLATINVAPVNDVPVATGDAFITNEDTPLLGAADELFINDSDIDNDPLIAVLATGTSNGSILLNADGSFEYTPDADFYGSDSFTYMANDGTVNSNLVTVNITINPVNDAPVAMDDTYTTDEDTPLNIISAGVLTNDSDVEGNSITAQVVNSTSNGSLSLNPDGSFNYVPDANFNGSDSFTYVANDGMESSTEATVTIVVNPVNDAPVAENLWLEVDENVEEYICINASDIDNDLLVIGNITTPVFGTTDSIMTDQLCFRYKPKQNQTGPDSFQVEICDNDTCIVITVDLEVIPPRDLLIFQALSPNGDARNDEWIIDGITYYPDNQIKIFNRYGQLVYHMKGYNNEDKVWKGESNAGIIVNSSQFLPDGTYFYTINLGNGSKPRQGYVVIAR